MKRQDIRRRVKLLEIDVLRIIRDRQEFNKTHSLYNPEFKPYQDKIKWFSVYELKHWYLDRKQKLNLSDDYGYRGNRHCVFDFNDRLQRFLDRLVKKGCLDKEVVKVNLHRYWRGTIYFTFYALK